MVNEQLQRFRGTNCIAYGQSRDERIVKLVCSGIAFTRPQIEQVVFSNRKVFKEIITDRIGPFMQAGTHKKMGALGTPSHDLLFPKTKTDGPCFTCQ